MSRKKPSFKQLVEYMQKETHSKAILHNLYGHERMTAAEIVDEFEKNAVLLPKRKNGNYLYHEILSIEPNDQLSDEVINEKLVAIGEMYLAERAPHQLAYSVIHRDTDNLHLHFCISANNIGEMNRVRLSKKSFSNIQKNLENYVLECHPELQQSAIYTKVQSDEKIKTSAREQALKTRSKQPSKKELLKNQLHGVLELAESHESLVELLKKEGYLLYTRGKTTGIIEEKTGRKHRLKTLGILPHYTSTLARLDQREKEVLQDPILKEKEDVNNTEKTTPSAEKKPAPATPKHEQDVKPESPTPSHTQQDTMRREKKEALRRDLLTIINQAPSYEVLVDTLELQGYHLHYNNNKREVSIFDEGTTQYYGLDELQVLEEFTCQQQAFLDQEAKQQATKQSSIHEPTKPPTTKAKPATTPKQNKAANKSRNTPKKSAEKTPKPAKKPGRFARLKQGLSDWIKGDVGKQEETAKTENKPHKNAEQTKTSPHKTPKKSKQEPRTHSAKSSKKSQEQERLDELERMSRQNRGRDRER